MRELVKDRPEQARFAPAEHRVEHGVRQVPERRVGRHAADADVVALRGELAGACMGVLGVEETEIGHAAGDRETPAVRLDRELGGRHDAPDRKRAAEIGIAPETAAIRQAELLDRKFARFGDQLEALARRRPGRRVRRDFGDRLAAREHVDLPARRLHQVAAGKRQADCKGC